MPARPGCGVESKPGGKKARRLPGARANPRGTVRRARLTQVAEFAVQGVANADIAKIMNIHPSTVSAWKAEAGELGLVEQARQRIQKKLLPKAEQVYEEILSATAEDITAKKTVKAHELRLKAAQQIAQGLGALRKDPPVKVTQRMDLEGYLKQREARRLVRPAQGEASEQDWTYRTDGLLSLGAEGQDDAEGGRDLRGDRERSRWEVLAGEECRRSDEGSDSGGGGDLPGAGDPGVDQAGAGEE